MTGRVLTVGETALARSMFGEAIDYSVVRLHRRKWAFFQPRRTVMAPDGHIWFHPEGSAYCHDFCTHDHDAQGLFIHEMTHVWQRQKGIFLPLVRHPFCRYDYVLKPGWPLERYGIEQQAEIVRHAFLLRKGHPVIGAPPVEQYQSLTQFAFM
jgi:hypothetical protein